jgi:hypothetical protein
MWGNAVVLVFSEEMETKQPIYTVRARKFVHMFASAPKSTFFFRLLLDIGSLEINVHETLGETVTRGRLFPIIWYQYSVVKYSVRVP